MQALRVLLVAAAVVLVGGCGKSCGRQAERTTVTVSIYPLYDLARRVAGPDADVTLVIPAGASEHGFTPSAAQRTAAAQSKLIVMIGLGLDGWMEPPDDASPKPRVVKVGDRVPTLPMRSSAEGAEASDPHVWLDPARMRLAVRAIAEELGRVDAAHALDYRRRATEVDTSLASLDKQLEDRTRALTRRSLVTFHDAFAYFAERYKLEVVGVVEPAPPTPPSPAHLAQLRETLKSRKPAAIYREPQLDASSAVALATETATPQGTLDLLGGKETESYEKLMLTCVAELERHMK